MRIRSEVRGRRAHPGRRTAPSRTRGLIAVVAAFAAVAGLALTDAVPATAATRAMPGSFSGYAFDACQAPAQEEMDAWREHSPYAGVGIYTSGINRYCDVQTYLSPDWVSEQANKGWRLFPLHVGLQASCRRDVKRWELIDPSPADDYAGARAQGREQADEAVAAAQSYGLGVGSTLWYDLEAFDIGNADCRLSALALVSAWTERLHDVGYDSGYYSSAASGIRMLDDARLDPDDAPTLPDRIWVAHYVRRDPPCKLSWGTTSTEYLADDAWRRHRMRQFCGTHTETYGGVSLSIDSNYTDFGRGTLPPKAAPHCGVRVDFPRYPKLQRGDRGDRVKAGQCFLRRTHEYDGRIHGRFTRATAKAVRRFQRDASIPLTGTLNGRTWTALLS
ncbi:MAG TPA: glycoside hydrolase domain-containing protein, partial [Streptomyces sp.]|nr:glycoside hydrolase domain-containing protein [Streptomyces sp.]